MARGEAGSVVTVVSFVLITFPHWHTRSVMPYLYGALWLYRVASQARRDGFGIDGDTPDTDGDTPDTPVAALG